MGYVCSAGCSLKGERQRRGARGDGAGAAASAGRQSAARIRGQGGPEARSAARTLRHGPGGSGCRSWQGGEALPNPSRGRCSTWSRQSGWSCARAFSLGYVMTGGSGEDPPPAGLSGIPPCLLWGASAEGSGAVTSGAWGGRSRGTLVRAASTLAAGWGSAGSGQAREVRPRGPRETCRA